MSATIQLPITRGLFAIVDLADAPLVLGVRWHAVPTLNTFYAARKESKKGPTIYMHRLLMEFPERRVDHVNWNGLDNRRSNMRLANASDNATHSKLYASNTTGFRGVCFDKSRGLYVALIQVGQQRRTLGRFPTPEAAARRYDAEALAAFGAFAVLNFPNQ